MVQILLTLLPPVTKVFDLLRAVRLGLRVDDAPLFETKLLLDLFVLWKVVLLGILTRIQVIENAEKLVETVSGRQMFVPVAQVVLSELPGHVTLILQHPRKGGIFGLKSFLAPGSPTVLRPVRMGYWPRMKAARPAVHEACA